MSRASLLLAVYAAWGLLYIWRTTFELGGERVFVLWHDAMISLRYAQNLAAGQGLRARRARGLLPLAIP